MTHKEVDDHFKDMRAIINKGCGSKACPDLYYVLVMNTSMISQCMFDSSKYPKPRKLAPNINKNATDDFICKLPRTM